jgi:hypothetical protein
MMMATILIVTACSEPESSPTATSSPVATPAEKATQTPVPQPPTPTSTPVPSITSSPEPTSQATQVPTPATETQPTGVLYRDWFKDTSSGWPSAEYDNFYIGYHEPEFYHVEVHEPNDNTIVVLPGKEFDNVTTEVEVFADEANTSQSGAFRYGMILRRSGNQYYAFMISPGDKAWYVLRNSSTGPEVLDEGTEETIQGLAAVDILRVDANGPAFTFHVNGKPVSQIEDATYAIGDLGFIVETFDSPRAHIHYDSLTIRDVSEIDVIYNDKFKNTSSGWPSAEYDNFYIGYHEPEFYHVEVHEPNDNTIVVLPGKEFADITTEVEVFADEANTSQSGDFRYGLVLRRSGNQYYAFVISPSTKAWHVLKNSPTGLEILEEGTDETIQGLAQVDKLGVDANGPIFTFHINGQPVSQVEDSAYAAGDLGFIVETFDSPRAHIHYDSLTIREARPPQQDCTVDAAALNLRSGPGLAYSPPITILPNGTRLEPLARSSDGQWIQIRVQGSDQIGWVAAYSPYIVCNFSVIDLSAE